MKTYRKTVSEPWFTLIGLGIKTVEGRLCKGEFARMKQGDVVVWENGDLGFPREVRTRIVRVDRYDDFREYLTSEGLRACLPAFGVDSVDVGVDVYRRFYSVADEREHGVLAIRLASDTARRTTSPTSAGGSGRARRSKVDRAR